MGTITGLLAEARKSLGLREPNHIQDWYADRNGAAYRYNFPWCDAAVTYWAYRSGNHTAVCPAGDRAYTVWHAQDFRDRGRWHHGTAGIRAGDIVFFDWGNRDSIAAIDHVGIVEKVLSGGRVQTIEGNTANVCARRIRTAGPIAGYGRPAYTGTPAKPAPAPAPAPKPATSTVPRFPGRLITQPPVMRGDDVRTWQGRMKHRGWVITVDGAYGPKSEKVCRAFQTEKRLTVDGIVGPKTWAAAWTTPIT
jgi:hypothetical protein